MSGTIGDSASGICQLLPQVFLVPPKQEAKSKQPFFSLNQNQARLDILSAPPYGISLRQ